jgi:hypothetical protein
MKPQKSNLTFKAFYSQGGKIILTELAGLRIEVFREYPYLYQGDMNYEKKYLERYFSAINSFVFSAYDGNELIGATTAILLSEEDEMIKKPFKDSAYNTLDQIVYFGESIVRKTYRGNGLGKIFFEKREEFAQSLPNVKWTSFCAVVRPENDPRKSSEYHSPENLWHRMGYRKIDNLSTEMHWQEIGHPKPTAKKMQFWLKALK